MMEAEKQTGKVGRVSPYGIRIGVICDLFFYESVCASADVRYISPEDAFFDKADIIVALVKHSKFKGLPGRNPRARVPDFCDLEVG